MNAKEAANVAMEYVIELIPSASEILLEEVEKEVEGEQEFWLITLSMTLPTARRNQRSIALAMAALESNRDYKTFKVDAQTGEVISMKIRSLR